MSANGQKLRVAVTKTSAQGKAAQSATPNLMSFSTDENSIWFNGKKYGVYVLKGLNDINDDSNSQEIQSFLGDFTYDKWEEARNVGSLVFVTVIGMLCPAAIDVDTAPSDSNILVNIFVNSNVLQLQISVQYSASTGYSAKILSDYSVNRSDIVNSLDKNFSDKPLSAAMGKKLNDEKLPKSFVVNNLTTTDTTKALSAMQGKVLNDKISALGSVYRIKGSKTNFSEVLALTDAKVGDAWNVTNAFTFGGKPYPANTNVVCLVATSTSDHDEGNWDPIGGTVDLSPYAKKTEVEKSDNEIWEQLNVVVNKDEIVNNLTSTNTDKPLSAAMGKKLNDEKLPKSFVVNNLTTTDTTKALSAMQGKVLNDKISALGSVYRIKGSKTNFSEVLALTDAKVGDAWNVTNAFTFGGKPYPANTNVVCLVATSTSDHDEGNWDPIGGTVDLSPYAKKTEVEKSDNEIWEQLNVVVNKDEIVNNLTSTNTDKPLSAAMGKKLQDEKLSKTDANNTYLTKVNAESTYAKKADGISHYSIGELTALSSNPTQEQLKTALGTPSAFRNAIDAGKLILVTGHANVQSQKSATCIIDSGNVIVKYLHPGNNDWTVIAKCVPASSGDNWDNAQFSTRTVKPSDSVGITIE